MRIRLWSAVAAVLLLAACAGPRPEVPQHHSGSKPDTSGIEITGDASDPVNKLAIEAIADLRKYWGEEYPKTYEGDYQAVRGGFFAVLPSSGDLPPCVAAASDISGNAFYNRPDTSTYHISPGDLDEGIKALLVFRGEGDADRQGAGFERVRAFREGVMNGAESCVGYQGKNTA